MNPNAFENKDREYYALLIERDPKSYTKPATRRWVIPVRVYKGVRGRQQIEITNDSKKEVKENWPGAASFELYKRVP